MDVTFDYRYQSSYRHFIGTVEQKQREVNHNQVETETHLMDVNVTYDLNRRWELTGILPIMVADRNQIYTPKGYFHVAGVGDAIVRSEERRVGKEWSTRGGT